MFTVTESALGHLAKVLENEEVPESTALRITAEKDGLGLVLDEARDGDSSHTYEGRVVLVVEESIAEFLTDRVLDLKPTDEGDSLALL